MPAETRSHDEWRNRLGAIFDAGPPMPSSAEIISLANHHPATAVTPTVNPRIGRRRLVVSVSFALAIAAVVVLVTSELQVPARPGMSTTQAATGRNGRAGSDQSYGPIAPKRLVREATSVPGSVYDSVGLPPEIDNVPRPATKAGQPPAETTSDNGKPTLLYVWASYCPFCAAENWSLVLALSRFGTFHGLRLTSSSALDAYPDTETLSFYGATYTSRYLDLAAYDLATNKPAAAGRCDFEGYACLQKMPAEVANVFKDLGGKAMPFTDYGRLFQSGAAFGGQPEVLAGLTPHEIAADLRKPDGAVARAEVGEANYITAAICSVIHDAPGGVCSGTIVSEAQSKER